MKFRSFKYCILISLIFLAGCSDTSKIEEVKKESQQIIKKEVPKKVTISVKEKKKIFIDTLVPISTKVYKELEQQYQMIKNDISNNTNRIEIDKLKKEYNAKTDELLLQSLKPHSISILLAQAAAESAWLTSRFTKEANNIFGVWSFNKKEPRIAASGLRGDKTIYLKKYKTLEDAVRDYYKNLAKNWAYKEFRKERTLISSPYILVDYLKSYSEKKEIYTELLKSMIRYNKFEQYDIKSKLPRGEIKIKKIISNDLNVTTEVSNELGSIVIDNNVSNDMNTTSAINILNSINEDLNITQEPTKKIENDDLNKTINKELNSTLENNETNIEDLNVTREKLGKIN